MEGSNDFFLLTMESLLENTQDYIYVMDTDQRYVACSRKFAELVNRKDSTEVLGKTVSDLFDQELASYYSNENLKILKTGISVENRTEFVRGAKGEFILLSLSRYAVKDSSHKVVGLYGVGRDVTSRMEVQEEREYRVLSALMFEDVIQADLSEDRILKTEDSSWLRELKLTQETCGFTEMMGEMIRCFIHPDHAQEFKRIYNREKLLREYKGGIREFTHITHLSKNGTDYRWIECRTWLYWSDIFGTVRMAVFLCDKDEEIRHHQELKRRAETDVLTGLMNRESMARYIGECIEGNGRVQTHALILVTLKVSIRHEAGDGIVTEMAKRLRDLFRESDLVGRIGGDEFMIFMKNTVSVEDIKKKAEKIVSSIPLLKFPKKEEVLISCNVGISTYWNNGKDFKTLYEEAEKALIQAKYVGENGIVFYGT